jgi:hypothetical protein|tara:strand:- start:583 stop:1053 length:471 start_codon:yes stop_codon:yes gene_type:complete
MAMIGSVIIACPLEQVFEVTNNHVTEWSNIVEEEETLNVTPEVIGSTFRTVTSEHGRKLKFDGVVTRHSPPFESGIRMEGPAFSLTVDYTFENVPEGTRVTQRSTVTGKGIFRIIISTMGFLMKKSNSGALQDELNRLKAFCENPPKSGDSQPQQS